MYSDTNVYLTSQSAIPYMQNATKLLNIMLPYTLLLNGYHHMCPSKVSRSIMVISLYMSNHSIPIDNDNNNIVYVQP